jgi:flagellar M-ring protein FliF
VPGALSNQPPAAGTAVLDAKVAATTAAAPAAAPTSMRKDETVAYEVDKKIEHTKGTIGGLRRLTAAVVVNHRRQTDAAGKVTQTPLSPQEMEQITSLVREAMGFSKDRGDSLNVVNAAFSEPPKEVIPEVPLWKRPDTIEMAKDGGRYLVFALVIGYLFFGVLRPMWRQAAARAFAPPPEPLPALTAPNSAEALQRARQIARDDPKVVANVVKTWVGSNG